MRSGTRLWRCAVLRDRGGRGLSPFSGGLGEGETPLPIPNRAVKPLSADGTWLARAWESRTPPVFLVTRSRPEGRLLVVGARVLARTINARVRYVGSRTPYRDRAAPVRSMPALPLRGSGWAPSGRRDKDSEAPFARARLAGDVPAGRRSPRCP